MKHKFLTRLLIISSLFLTGCTNNDSKPVSSSPKASEKAVEEGDVCTDIIIKQMPSKLNYLEGEKFKPNGIIFDAVYQNGFEGDKNLTAGDLDGWTPSTPLTINDTKVKLIYEGFEKEIDITVKGKELTAIAITHEPDIKSYRIGEALNLTGLVVKATYGENEKEESLTEYTIADSEGKTYENGSLLETANEDLELYVFLADKPKIKASFHIAIFAGFSIQAEDIKTTDFPEEESYVTIESQPNSDLYHVKKDLNFSGTGYLGDVKRGFEMTFHIYSEREAKDVSVILIAASTYLQEGGMGNVQVNQVFDIYVDDEQLSVDDSIIIPGLSVVPKGTSRWTNWADAFITKMDLKAGFTTLKLKCIGMTKGKDNYDRAPNIDRLDIRF